MNLERVDALGEDDTYELNYKIEGLNRMYNELYGESKKELFDKILNEDTQSSKKPLHEAARVRLSVELRQFVGRFVYNMSACEAEGKDEDDLYDEYAELALKIANWCGLPEQVLPYLNYILSDDCLYCDMWKLTNHIVKYLNSK